jgi:hypothetical protein
LICVPLLLCACIACGDNTHTAAAIEKVGNLSGELDEASGLAQSRRDADLLWVVNDDGAPTLHAIDHQGKDRGRVTMAGARNTDWEDLAAFDYQGDAYLVVADIGDNEARRAYVTLYVLLEPAPEDNDAAIAWTINFRYPDGPRDAESLAVDAAGEQLYVLSKRDVPAVLYALPLRPGAGETIVATRLASIDSLPQPSQQQQRQAARNGWAWQPTAMDFSADGRSALVLTYQGVYVYPRAEQQTWAEALRGSPLELELGEIRQAEAVALVTSGNTAYLTIELERAPLYRIDLPPVRPLQ